MTNFPSRRWARWSMGAALVIATSAPAAATCADVHGLLSQGLSVAQVSAVLNAPVAAVQACLQPRPVVVAPGNRSLGRPARPARRRGSGRCAAGPAPLGAAGPAPSGAAGPAPINAPSKPQKVAP
jgi:hypothetical protein